MGPSTRRELIKNLGMGAAGLMVTPSLFAKKVPGPNDKLTVACIGVGSQGLRVLLDLLRLEQVQIVAVCDVNRASSDYLEWGANELRGKVRTVLQDPNWGAQLSGPTAGREVAQGLVNAFYAKDRGRSNYSGCRAYEDFRELLAKEKDLDAVTVSTPDHWHAPIAIAAMRDGKHVYSQKPMAHNVWEAREMPRVAKETGRATQVSIFNSDSEASRQVHDTMQTGAIGAVRSIDIWTRRASAFWRQGLSTPIQADPVTPGLNWDLWLGPAKERPFNRAYLPFVWRAWYDFGCGALGDMGEYGMDTITRAVGLGVPDRIDVSTTEHFELSYPVASTVHFHFPATEKRPELMLNWFDGGIRPERPAEMPAGVPLTDDGEGVIYTGEKGKLLTGFMGANARLLRPDGKLSALYPPPSKATVPFAAARPELGESASGADAEHYLEWVNACHGGAAARANYEFESHIVETLMLGCIAQRTQESLAWDSAAQRFTRGSAEATALIKPPYRAPFVL